MTNRPRQAQAAGSLLHLTQLSRVAQDGSTQFELPAAPVAPVAAVPEGTTSSSAALPPGWQLGRTPDGVDPLYVNTGVPLLLERLEWPS